MISSLGLVGNIKPLLQSLLGNAVSLRSLHEMRASLDRDGWVTTPPVYAPPQIDSIVDDLQPALDAAESRSGVRNLLTTSELVRTLAAEGPLRDAATAALDVDAGAVRAILFDKTPDANWKVVWHQDLTIAVADRREAPDYGPWSVKDGVIHVQPPARVLEKMVAVRLHLDECGLDNGPVRVLSTSHLAGKLTAGEVDHWRGAVKEDPCIVPCGGLLLFRPLILHASSQATRPAHRRVLHIEYGPPILPQGLSWHCWVPKSKSRAA